MKCKKCGAELGEDLKKCPECGAECEISKAENAASDAKSDVEMSEFDKQYSLAFEEKTESGSKYHVDEELKKKREARYDESFANMSDDEKIKALEAARLARKEKREQKAKKKEGGLTSRFEKVSAPSGSQGTKASAPKPKKQGGAKHSKPSPKLGLAVGGVIAVAVIIIIIAAVSMASKVNYELPESPTVYTKDNTLYSAYDGKEIEISETFIASEYQEPVPTATATPNGDDDDEDYRATATPEPYYEPVTKSELVTSAEDGLGTYFIDNTDLNTNSGSLNYSKSGVKKGTKHIADDVYYDIVVSSDGSGVLYLTDTDKYGAGGTLNYWSTESETATVLSVNVLPNSFVFGQNGSILYITDYNSEYYVGDLYFALIEKGVPSESKKIDSDVYEVFGTNTSGRNVVYAKNYDDNTKCFEIYLTKTDSGETVMVTDGSRIAPIFRTTADGMYAGGSYADYYQTLYYVSLESGEKEKLSGNLTELIKMSSDEQAVIFRRANAEGTAFDYYYANMNASEGQILAQNVTVLDDPDHSRVTQVAVNDDFTRVAYIQGYDVSRESGALYTLTIEDGLVGMAVQISDSAYSCNVTPDGLTVRYAGNYDMSWNLVTLNSYTSDKNTVLATEVGSGAFTFDKAGKYIIYAQNYSIENKTGDVYRVNQKGKVKEIVLGVSSYGLKDNGAVVYYNNVGGAFELFTTNEDASGSKTVDKDVTEVISY